MRDQDFQTLRQELLDAGIALRYVNRIEHELRDHLLDLEREAVACGWSREQAVREASRRIGARTSILHAFTQHPELQCWIYRSKLIHSVLRVLVVSALSLQRCIRHPVLGTATRFSLAGLSAAVVTAGLLLGLSLSLNGRPDQLSAGPLVAAALSNDSSAPDRRQPRSPLASEDGNSGSQTLYGIAVSMGDGGRQLTVDPARRKEATDPLIRVPEKPPEVLAIVPYAAAIVAELATPAPIEIDSTALLTPEPFTVAGLAADSMPGRPLTIPDGGFLPIVKVSPVYPARAAARGIEGYVVIEYTVTPAGTVSDLVVIESSSPLFERPALRAAAQFKFKPRVVGGESIAVQGVRTIIRFEIDA